MELPNASPHRASLLILLFAIVGFLPDAKAQRYVLQDLGTLGGNYSNGNGLNMIGQVVGSAQFTDGGFDVHPFLSGANGESLADLGTLGGAIGEGLAVNASGQVVGDARISDNSAYHAFISAPGGGALTDLGTLGGKFSQAFGINDSGQVVGVSGTSGPESHAFISAADGGLLTDLGTLGGTYSEARGINSTGKVVGYSWVTDNTTYHAFLSAPNGGALGDLGSLGGDFSQGYAVNESGQVAGVSYTDTGEIHAFLSAADGGALGDLGTLGSSYSEAFALNNQGDVVGASNIPAGDKHAFIYTAGRGMKDLNSEIPVASGALLQTALAINDAGQIVSNGTNKTGGQMHAFLLTPLHIDSMTKRPNGNILLQGQTIPNGSVRIEASLAPGTGFSPLETIVADATGSFTWEDLETAGFPRRFYRAALPIPSPLINASTVKALTVKLPKEDGSASSRPKGRTSALR
jgi:probable HAF family extracellular repeat protein